MSSIDILCYMASFAIFIVLQSLFINGLHFAFRGKEIPNDLEKGATWDGNILYPIRRILSPYMSEWWKRPAWGCVSCMGGPFGTLTLMPMLVYLFGFHWQEIPIQIFDTLVLCSLNDFIYKKI